MAGVGIRAAAGRIGGGADVSDILPSQSLYCNNLNDQIHISDLAGNLYELFCQHGEVIDIVAQNGKTKRGQAFVVFRDIGCATAALRSLQGRNILGKPIRIQYSKTKSDAVSKLDGTFKPRKGSTKRRAFGDKQHDEKGVEQPVAANVSRSQGAKSFTMFVQNLPTQMTKKALEILFGQYPGCLECRLITGRAVAFVDFATESQAEVCMQGLQGFRVTPDHTIKVSWAKQGEEGSG